MLVVACVVAGALALACAVLVLGLRPGRIPPYRDAAGRRRPGSIAEWVPVRVGGIDQWLAVWGRSQDLPVLLFLHGGPGSAETPFLLRWNRDLGDHFIVASWDQRGAGKTAFREAPPASFTIEQFVSDVHEITGHLQDRFGRRKIYLVGHSWGAVIGLLAAAQHPDAYEAYVGLSQPLSFAAGALEAYRWALSAAGERGDRRAAAELRAIGEPVAGRHRDGAAGLERQLGWVSRFGGGSRHDGGILPLAAALFGSPAYSMREKVGYLSTNGTTARLMYDEMIGSDRLLERVRRLDIPVYLCHGRFDMQVPLSVTERLFSGIAAPVKRLFVFEQSAHGLLYEEPARFHDILVGEVLGQSG